jgi:hypothetical protein
MVNKRFNSSKKTSKRKISNSKRAAANTRWENSCQGFSVNDYLLSRIQKKQIKIEDIGKWNNYKIKSHFCTGRINGDKCCDPCEKAINILLQIEKKQKEVDEYVIKLGEIAGLNIPKVLKKKKRGQIKET